jgi:hypothetical protein
MLLRFSPRRTLLLLVCVSLVVAPCAQDAGPANASAVDGHSTVRGGGEEARARRGIFDVWAFENYWVVAVGDAGAVVHPDGTGLG